MARISASTEQPHFIVSKYLVIAGFLRRDNVKWSIII